MIINRRIRIVICVVVVLIFFSTTLCSNIFAGDQELVGQTNAELLNGPNENSNSTSTLLSSSNTVSSGSDSAQGSSSGGGALLLIVIIILVSRSRKKRAANKSLSPCYYNSKLSRAPSYSQDLSAIDYMDGHSFEYWCADLLQYNGFSNIQVTPGSGDQGVDIIAWKEGQKYAIQCKRYSKNLGNKSIQEVNTGRTIYGCNKAAVMTNQYFTSGAVNAANAVGVLLWGRDSLANMLGQKNAALYKQSKEYKRQEREKKRQLRKQGKKQKTIDIEPAKWHQNQIHSQPTSASTPVSVKSTAPKTSSSKTPAQHRKVSWNDQVIKAAKEYLSSESFSRKGLIEQLKHDGFSHDQAEYAAYHCGANWLMHAQTEVKSYLATSGYSRSGLIEQLTYDGYTQEEAESAVDSCGVLWKYQAFREAKSYLKLESLSKEGLIEKLEYDGFTHEEATYAAEQV